jgi:crotonobetainyl-CoA:carnitine CoA-transferase CaiB-like acyl-CoA transferase
VTVQHFWNKTVGAERAFDPASGKDTPLPETPIRLSATPGKVRFPGLPMGAANEVILGDLLGYSSEEIADLKSSGAI